MSEGPCSGGCQCGAVRFVVDGALGRASICHCRMCQKAFGGFFGPLVSAPGLRWTRGAPNYFQSSNRVRRGFCAECGTPLTFEPDDGPAEVAIGAFDDPAELRPVIQHDVASRLPWVDQLGDLPVRTTAEAAKVAPYYASIRSFQHPDHDTEIWPSDS
jgi:hypothetical protein